MIYNILGPLNMHSKHYPRHDCHCRIGHPHDQHLLNTLQNHVVSCKNIITSCVRCGSKFLVKVGEVRRGSGGGSWDRQVQGGALVGGTRVGLRGDAPANKRFKGLNRAFSCQIFLPQSLTLLPCKMKEGCMYNYIIIYASKWDYRW